MTDPPSSLSAIGQEPNAAAIEKLKTYAECLPYSIEPNSEMQKLLDFYLVRITQVSLLI